jgi:hypothetical protein
MRSSTFSIAAILALVASVAAAPVASEETVSVVPVVVEDTAPVVVGTAVEVAEDSEDTTGVYHLLEKRTQKCTNGKATSCSQTIPSYAYRVCSSKICTWVSLLRPLTLSSTLY